MILLKVVRQRLKLFAAVAVGAVVAFVLHAQMDSADLEGLWQGQNVGIGTNILLHCVGQGLFEGGTGFQTHATGDAGLLSANNVDGGGVHLGDVAAGHHGEAVEGMEGVGKTILADILLVGGEVLTVTIHVGQYVHVVVLEHIVQLPQVGPALVMEVAVTDGRANDDAVVAHNSFVADDLCGQSLHHLDGVGAHAIAVVEVLGHTEDQNIVLLLSPGYISTLVGDLPGYGHHLLGVAGVDGDLAGVGIQHRVAAEEGMAHTLFHMHADLVELGTHHALAGDGGEVLAVHDIGNVVGGDGAPVGDAGGAVLIAAGVAAVGVALGVADEDGDVCLEDVLVHQHGVTPVGGAQIHHVFIVFGIVRGDLIGPVELIEQLLAQDFLVLLHGGAGVQAVGDQQQDVLLLHTAFVQNIQTGPNGDLAVGSGLQAALHNVGDNEDDLLTLAVLCQFPQGGHTNRVLNGLPGGLVERIPVLGQAKGILDGLTGDKHVGIVRQLRCHHTVTILKFKLQNDSSFLCVD